MKLRRLLLPGGIALVVGLAALAALSNRQRMTVVPPGFALGNGRIEATEIDVATTLGGRVETVDVQEGDRVEPNQVLASMDTRGLRARLRQAEAELARSKEGRKVAEAFVAQRESESELATLELQRAEELSGTLPEQERDRARTRAKTAEAALAASRAQVLDAAAATQVAEARCAQLKVDLEESVLRAPRAGRVLYRLGEPGEVLAPGGKVVTLVDLSDMHMTVFLGAQEAGQIPLEAEARLVLDALPEHPVSARVGFVSPSAQFTPKQVETQSERQKLVFRVKVFAQGPADDRLKPGMPGVAWVRLDPTAPWPDAVRPPRQ